jgi:putative oxidoreductase
MTQFFMTNGLYDSGLLIIRVGLGIIFVIHGYPKIVGGPQSWLWLGSNMENLGIYSAPLLWGFIAACTEFFGGILLITGFFTRIVCFFLVFQMLVALLYHLNKGDGFMIYSHPLSLMIVFIGLFFVNWR